MRRLVLLAAVAACGDNLAAEPDGSCTATFSGNFSETSNTAGDCPLVKPGGLVAGDQALDIQIPIASIGTSIGITIDLGAAATPGTYSSETTARWSALALRHVATGECIYYAADDAVPAGSFMLTLDSLDGATGHGSLELLEYVLRYVDDQGHESECGAGDTEHLELMF